MTAYLDIIFVENLCMNYIILFTTGYFIKTKANPIRLFISSCCGSIYAILMYIYDNIFFPNFFIKIILSVVIILIAFYPKDFRNFFKQLIIFYLISFVFGGCAMFLLYFIKPQNVLIRNGVYVGRYPIKIVLLGGIVGFIITKISFRFVKGKIGRKDMYVKLKIFNNNNSVQVKALIDTGNMLKDPITKTPVIVVEANSLAYIIPDNILNNLQKIILGEYEEIQTDYISKFRVIPFSSIGKQNGILLGFKIDKVIIKYDGKNIESREIIVGIYDKELSKNKEYSALVGLDLLEGDETKNEYLANANR